MRVLGVVLALGLSTVNAYHHGFIHKHRRNMDLCDDCVTSTITTWVEYTLPTSTVTVWTTEQVVIDYADTTTITYTLTDGEAAPGGRRAKRGAIRDAILHGEDSASTGDKGTSYITTPATSTSTDCFETTVAAWVPYDDDQLVIGEDGYPSMSASASASITSTKASKVYRQDPDGSSTGTTTSTSTTAAGQTTTTTTTTTSSDPPPSASAVAGADPSNASAPAPAAPAAPAAPPALAAPPAPPASAPAAAPASSIGGSLYAMTYTPYDSTGACMSAGAVLAQLQDIQSKGFNRIRMYGVDCNQLSTVADQAISLGFSLTLGVYIDGTGTVRGTSDLDAILAWGNWGPVGVINIGNEAVISGFLTADELVAFIQVATQQLRGAGYSGIISTAETVGTYQSYPSICECLDSTVHANIHAFFDPSCPSSGAGQFVVSQKGLVESACGGKTVIVSETGWPSGGGDDRATPGDQATAISSIDDATNGDVTFFSYSDDAWKAPGIEQHFGISPRWCIVVLT